MLFLVFGYAFNKVQWTFYIILYIYFMVFFFFFKLFVFLHDIDVSLPGDVPSTSINVRADNGSFISSPQLTQCHIHGPVTFKNMMETKQKGRNMLQYPQSLS